MLCHHETLLQGGFGRTLNPDLVVRFRNDWVKRVSERRVKADGLAAARMAESPRAASASEEAKALSAPRKELAIYVRDLPGILAKSVALAAPGRESGVTQSMVQATDELTGVLVQILVHLASWFPKDHFDGQSASEYFSLYISNRAKWRRALAEPDGVGTGGTLVRITTAYGVFEDARAAVDDVVSALFVNQRGFDLPQWRMQWKAATEHVGPI